MVLEQRLNNRPNDANTTVSSTAASSLTSKRFHDAACHELQNQNPLDQPARQDSQPAGIVCQSITDDAQFQHERAHDSFTAS